MSLRTVLLTSLALGLGCGEPAVEPPEAPVAPPVDPDPSAFDGLEGFWSEADARAVLDRSGELELGADLSRLTEEERDALAHLIEAGEAMARIYRVSRHPDALRVHAHLHAFSPTSDEERARLEALIQIESLFQGPIARTPDGGRATIAPVEAYRPGRNVYPADVTAEALRAAALADPRAAVLDPRTVVRRRSAEALDADRAAVLAHPWVSALHPDLSSRLEAAPEDGALYGVPYALAYADDLELASRELFTAADALRAAHPDFAAYLAQRARDLLTNDYEGGDALWVTARPATLNLELGAYETYDDHLAGQKTFAAASILLRDTEASDALARAIDELPALEAALPGGPYGDVHTRIPIGIYDVIADFGQARGGNTASILPNDADITRRHGRIILVRRNVIEHPVVVGWARARFAAAVDEAHVSELGPSGNLDRTVWHEVGHYLGPKTAEDGRPVTQALGSLHNCIEELKADLVSLWLMPRLVAAGVLDEARRRDAYAAGVLRVLVTTEPRRTDAYGTMQLMQQRWLLARGVLRWEEGAGLTIDYARYPEAVEAMLTEVLRFQRAGDAAAAERFVGEWAVWDPAVQGAIGRALEGAAPRYWLPSYAALAEGE